MTRTRTNTLIVDGEPYRWRASRRAIMVEHAEMPRGRVREFLTVPESIDPTRVQHLVRHARNLGWRPTEDDDVFEIATSTVWDDPRLRDHYQWMRLMLVQLHHMEQFLGCPVEVGAYWWHGYANTALGGFGARLRFHSYAPMPDADLWEAAYCITGTEGERAYTDMFAFPFSQGQNLGLQEKRVWLFWLKQDCERNEGVWRDQGWQPWDKPEQWSHAVEPGRVFFALEPAMTSLQVKHGEPILCRMKVARTDERPERITYSLHQVREESRGDLVRAGAGDRWFSWDEAEAVAIDRSSTTTLVELDVGKLDLAGGWEPGRYTVELRLRCEHPEGEGHSDISQPLTIEIS